MNVTLHAMDTSIHHFNNTIENNFLDPLIAVRDTTEKLYSNPEVLDELRYFTFTYFSSSPVGFIMYSTLPDDSARTTYLNDVYKTQHFPSNTSL